MSIQDNKLTVALKAITLDENEIQYARTRLQELGYLQSDLEGLINLINKSKTLTPVEPARAALVFEWFYHYKRSQLPPLTEGQKEMLEVISKRLREITTERGTDNPKHAKKEEAKLKAMVKEIDPLYFINIEPDFK
jgi:hypothetical protein